MDILLISLLFLLGISLGSFIHALADRICTDQPFVNSRSHCDYCKQTLKWFELFPLLSFILLKGKCRYCKKTLTFWYPFTEAASGIMLVLLYLISPSIPYFLMISILSYVLFSILVADAKYGLIPLPFVLIGIVSSTFYYVLYTPEEITFKLLVGLCAFTLFFLIFYITKGNGMGFGDVIYAFLMGYILGFPQILIGLYLAFLTGAVTSLILILLKKKKLRGDTIPFGPFLVLGTFIALFFGDYFLSLAQSYLYYG